MATSATLPPATLRRIEERDLPVVLQIIQELAEFEKMPEQCVCTIEDLRASLFPRPEAVAAGTAVHSARALLLERPLAPGESPPAGLPHATSAVHPDRLVLGLCLYFFSFSTWQGQHNVHIEDLCIREPYRGKGYGTLLLHSMIQHAVKHHGAKRVEWVVLNWNKGAIQVYDRAGARPQNEWTTYRLTGDSLAAYADKENLAKVL